MTLCAGWICGDHAFLVVDSAVTVEGTRVAETIPVSTTTFGEREVSKPGTVVLEGAAKLFRLSDNVLAAFAGPTELALPVLRSLRYQLMETPDVRVVLSREQIRIEGFALGLAGVEHGAPRLWLAAGGRVNEIYEPNRVWVWGPSRETGLPKKVQEVIGRVASPTPRTFLARALAAVQVPLAASGTIERGVGGACFGACVSREGIETSGDSAFVIYEHEASPPILMHRIVVSGWRMGAQYSQAFIRDAGTGIYKLQTTVFESDEPFTDRVELERALRSLELTFPKPKYATLIDRRTASMAFVPLEERPDLVELMIGVDRVECHVYSDLLVLIDDVIRSATPAEYGLICVTKDRPKPGERLDVRAWRADA